MGRSSEISRDEVKFFKFIERLRMKFSEVFLELLRVQLVLKGVIRDEEWADIESRLAFKFAKDSHFTEIQENDILKDRLASAREAEDFVGKYYSREWVRKMILRQTEDDVEQIDKQIEEEKAAGLIVAPEGAAPPPEEPQAPPPAPAPAAGGDGQPKVTIGEIVPDDEKEWNS